MALELGLKVNNATSVSELRISKNTAGPVFVSTETHSSFILTCYLKGYDRNSFRIKINENGKEISISGEKPIQEMLMMGRVRVMLKKNVQIVGFKKVFEIPDGVVLDLIKAKFDEDESLLKIVMPKLMKGICGFQIEEVKKQELGESSQKASSETGENECVCRKEEGLSDKKLEESTNGNVIEGPRFEVMKESELRANTDHVPENIRGENIMPGRPHGTTREGEFEGTPKEEIGEVEFKNGDKDEEKVLTETSKEGFEAIETSKEEEETKKVLAGKIEEPKSEAEDTGEQREETEETKFEREGKDKERVGAEISKEGLEAIMTSKEGEKSTKVFDEKIGISEKVKAAEIEQGEVEELKSETEDRGEQKKETGETKFECEGKDEERVKAKISKEGLEAIDTAVERREPEKELGEAFGIDGEDIMQGKQKKEIKQTKFERESKGKERVGAEISKGVLEAIYTTKEERESEEVLAGAIRVDEKGRMDKNKQREVKEAKLKSEGEDEEMEGRETTKEAIETRMEGVLESKKVHGEKIEVSKEGIEQKEIEDEDKEMMKDIVGERQKREIQKLEPETRGRGEESVGTEASKEGLDAIESKIEGGKFKKVLVRKIGVSEEDRDKGAQQRETDETKFGIEDRDEEKVEQVLKGTQEKEIEKNEFAIEGIDKERVGTKIMEEFEAKDATREGGVSEKLFSDAAGISEKDIVEATKKGEVVVPKLENESRDEDVLKEEINKEDFEARKTKIKESPTLDKKLSIQMEESEVRKLKEIEEPKIPECATSEGQKLEEIEEATETEGILEKFEGEEPKMSQEASKVNGNDYARDSGKREIEDSAIRSSRDGHMRENIVSKVFEELETDTAKFPKQISETKAQREKEVKVKEEIIVKREKEVKVREVIVNKYDEAKEAFDKATTADRIQLETGQPSDKRGFDEETLEAVRWDKTKALKEGYGETETSLEKVKGESNDNVQGAISSPFMKDTKKDRKERAQKETEDLKVETKHKAQHREQELPTKIEKSMDEREGPKDTETGEMKEAKRKSEETQVVADKVSTVEKKIREAELERISQTNQFEKPLQEVPEAKDGEVLRKDMHEREIMLSTQQEQVKEIDKVGEECKRSEANLEGEKWRTTQSVKQVVESMQKAPEKEHPRKSEVKKEVKHLEEKVPYPKLRKEVETKYEVEGARLKELPPPKVKEQSLDPLESEKKNMKWKSPKTKKLAPEVKEREGYEAGKPPEVISSSSTQQSIVEEEKFEIDFPKSNTSRTPSEEKEIEAVQPNVLSDQNLEGKEHFKTLTEDRGHYLLDTEKRLEATKVAEEEKLNQKDEEETLSCQRERTKIAESKGEKRKTKRNRSEEINQIKAATEEFGDVLADNETAKSQEILLPQTAEIQDKEKISEIRQVQQEKRREIPFQANEESEAVISNREADSQKPNDAHPKESTIKFDSDKLKGKVHNGRHLEFQESEKQESELDFQESTRRRSDQEVEETHFSQQEENHEDNVIEEEKAGEAENVTQVEISLESEDLENIEVEANGKKVELCVPMVFAGSVFIASLIIFFFGRKGAHKR